MANTNYDITLRGKNRTDAAFNKANANVNSLSQSMGKLKGMIAGAFAVGALAAFGKSALELADNIGKVADSVGVSTDFLQRYQFAAQQSGLTTEEFNKGIQNFTKMVGQAAIRTNEAGRTLDKLGISLKNSDGSIKSTETVFVELFHALEDVDSEFRKNAILSDLMGRAGVKLSVLGKDGAEAMEALAAAATGVIDEETIRRAERFNDTMNILKRQVLGPLQELFITAANSVLRFLDAIGLISIPKTMTELQEELRLLTQQQQEFIDGQDNLKRLTAKGITDKSTEIQLLKEQIAELEKLEEARKILANGFDGMEETSKLITNISSTLTSGFTEFFDFTKQGFLDFENLAKKIVASVINEFIKVFIIKKLLGGFGDFLGGDIGKVFSKAAESFEGGGFTGMGVRAGGLDGRGGFMAMVHPNESIIDHTKGSQQGSTTVNFNINTVDAAGFDQLLIQRKGTITQIINNAMNNQGKMGVV